MTFRGQVVFSIFRRNFASYFSGVLGYLFIIVFVVAGGAMAFNEDFFSANEPNLDQLTQWFPLFLLFLVPAITMTIWSEERKLGTDELLFTLPVTDFEILLGKYLAVLAVYSVTLLFSTTYVLVLMYLGDPDWGLLFTTYFGYWIAGAALLSAGMLASVMTSSATVAFILGVIICAIPVFIGRLGKWIGFRDIFDGLSLHEQFRDFGMGIIPLSGVLYFVAFTILMLYLNLVFVTRRHWADDRKTGMGMQFSVRSVCLGVILACCTAWAGYAAMRVDATSEQLFSLSPVTRSILDGLQAERPIEIQAFLSPQVPREYVETRKRLVGLLRQFDELGGANLEVRYVDVEEFSQEAEEAEHFGIDPVRIVTEVDGRRQEVDVFLGAVVISSYDKVVVPFFGRGLPIEYELTRSVRTVAARKRHTVGVLQTDAQVSGGGREWQIVTELRKQYDIEDVSPATPIDAGRFDVLLAVMPSSLTAPEMDQLVNYVKAGHPALIFDDPFPLAFSSQFGVSNAPRHPKPRPGGMMAGMMGGQPPPEPKADGGRATRLLRALDIKWDYDTVVFDVNNPHPEYESLPREYLFVTRDGNPKAFNPLSPITRGLQQTLSIYSGSVQERDTPGRDTEFIELLRTGGKSGLLGWNEFVGPDPGFNFMTGQQAAVPMRDPLRKMDDYSHVLAAHIKSSKDGDKRNVVFVADVDMISDFFFQSRVFGDLDLNLDNVTFVLNAVDVLADDDAYIDLRSRRKKHRTLARVESQKKKFLEEANEQEQKADSKADEELEERRTQLKKRLEEIQENEDLDPLARRQMISQAEQAEQQRLNLAEARIEQEKNKEIRKINATTNRRVQSMESWIQRWAILLPAIPAFCIGLLVFGKRLSDEKHNVVEKRRRD